MNLTKNSNNFAQTNIFTFDQDDQQQIQWQQSSTHQQGPNIATNNNSNDSSQQNNQNQAQIFVFDQEPQSGSQQQKDQQQQVEQFAYIKNKILFRERDNYVNVNGLMGEYENQGSKVQNGWMKSREPKPETLTKRFESKVREVRKSLSGEQIQLDLRKVQSQMEKGNTPSRFEKQAKLERRSLMNNLDIQKENKHNHQDKQNTVLSQTSKNITPRGSFFKQPIPPTKSNFHPSTPAISLTPPQLQGAKVTLPASSQFHYVQQQKALKVTNMKQFLFTQLSQEYKVNLLITKCSSQGFLSKMINGVKYFVTIEENGKFLFSVVKDGMSRFVFSMNKEDCTEKNKGYLGQMKGEGLDKMAFVMYDYGFDPKETKCLEYSYKQLASIKYEQSSGPRKFSVILSTNNMGFSSIQDDVNILEKKWSSSKDRKNLAKVYSKEPQLDQTDGNYKLDFKGMMGKPSIKNFVLSSQEYEDCLIFARRNEDTYAVEVRNPFSLVQAVAVCMSSIYHKSLF